MFLSRQRFYLLTMVVISIIFVFSFISITSAQVPRSTIRLENADQLTTFSRFGHGRLVDAQYTIDGNTIIAATQIGVWLYNVEDLDADPVLLDNNIHSVSAIAQNVDGSQLAVATGNSIQIWDMTIREISQTFEVHERGIATLSFSPNGNTLVSGGLFDGQIIVLDVTSGEQIEILMPHGNGISIVTFSPDGAYLLTSGRDRIMRLWDTSTWSEVTFVDDGVNTVEHAVFDITSETVFTKDSRHQVSQWSLPDLAHIQSYEGLNVDAKFTDLSPDGIQLALNPSGTQLSSISADDQSIVTWDVASGELLTSQSLEGSELNSVVFSPDGQQMLAMGADLYIWDTETDMLTTSLDGFYDQFSSVLFIDEETAVLGNRNHQIYVIDIADNEIISTLSGHTGSVTSLALNVEMSLLASGGLDGTIILWDTTTWEIASTIQLEQGLTIHDVALSPDGRLVAGTTGFGFKIFSVENGTEQVNANSTSTAYALQFSPNGNTITTSHQDNSLILWDVATGEALTTYSENQDDVTDIEFTADGSYLFTVSSDATLQIVDMSDFSFQYGVPASNYRLWSVALSPSNALIATGSEAELKLWDWSTIEEIATYNPHTSTINAIAFSPLERLLATASNDGTVIFLSATR